MEPLGTRLLLKKKHMVLARGHLSGKQDTPSYPASSFPLTSSRETARLVKPACAVRDEDSRYEIEQDILPGPIITSTTILFYSAFQLIFHSALQKLC